MSQADSSMRFSLGALMRCSGNTGHDREYLAFFVGECVQLAEQSIEALESIARREHLDDLRVAADGNAAIARVKYALLLLQHGADFFSLKPDVAQMFSEPRAVLGATAQNVEAKFVALCKAPPC